MKLVFDLDGTLCSSSPGDYGQAKPHLDRIGAVNRLYEEGHEVVIFTARGMSTFKGRAVLARLKWWKLTKRQLQEWGIKHHRLILGKPSGDAYIDDKALSADEYFKGLM
jgi:hypothetical protein